MKDKKALKKQILEDEDFIYCPRLGNSLKILIDKNPDGVDNERIAKVLIMDVKEVQELYEQALDTLRKGLGVKEEE